MRNFLSKITTLTPIAAGAAVAMVVVGVLAIVGGNYDQSVVHDQLAPQHIYFPKPAEYASLAPYAGQQVLTGQQAKLYANDQLQPDMNKIAGGKSYAQVSEEWIAGGMKSPVLAAQRQTLFMGTTLKGLLLNVWGWASLGGIAILAGIILIVVGAILFVLPVLNYLLNIRPASEKVRAGRVAQAPVVPQN